MSDTLRIALARATASALLLGTSSVALAQAAPIVQPGAPGDKSHPHFFVGAADLMALFPDFEALSLVDNEGAKPGTWHFEFLATRVG